MSDLISRQAAIDEVNRLAKFFWEKWHEYAPSTIAVTDALKEIPSAQQWIPCSEQMPEEDYWSGRGRQFSHHVLVTIVNHGNDDEQFTDIAQTVDGTWQLSHEVDGDCRLPDWCEVIAWMPLPPAFKGEEK